MKRVLEARKLETVTGKGVRLFNTPKIDFDAKAYYELIDWQNVQITQQLLLLDVTDEEIGKTIMKCTFLKIFAELTSVSCLTQPFEREIKLVTAASSKVCGHKSRGSFMNATLLKTQQVEN